MCRSIYISPFQTQKNIKNLNQWIKAAQAASDSTGQILSFENSANYFINCNNNHLKLQFITYTFCWDEHYSGNFVGVPGSRGYFLGVGLSFAHMMAVLCPYGLRDSTG